MSFLSKAIISLRPGAQFSTNGDTITWHDTEQTQPSDSDIAAKKAELEAEYESKDYARKREREYPSIQECVHAILDDDLDALQAKRVEIKKRFPKT